MGVVPVCPFVTTLTRGNSKNRLNILFLLCVKLFALNKNYEKKNHSVLPYERRNYFCLTGNNLPQIIFIWVVVQRKTGLVGGGQTRGSNRSTAFASPLFHPLENFPCAFLLKMSDVLFFWLTCQVKTYNRQTFNNSCYTSAVESVIRCCICVRQKHATRNARVSQIINNANVVPE